MDIHVLNFDNSLTSQKNLLAAYSPRIIGLQDFSSSARLWMGKKTAEAIKDRIKGISGCAVNFLGSGDFHHVSSLLTEEIKESASLIVFDFHPDWDMLPPSLGCGSWVTHALRNPNIIKCLLIGASSCDLSFPYIQSGNLKSLENNRVEVYPYQHRPSSVFLSDVPLNKSIKLKKGLFKTEISWSELKGRNLNNFFLSLISNLPSKKVYVSIDKDCLKNDYALTNWEEGFFSLDELLIMLKITKENLIILGVDITGDYSQAAYPDIIKRIISRLDHPKNVKADRLDAGVISSINEATNLKLLSVLNP
ncbi:MAG: hypothetical protein JXL82_00300 [Candidatus Omnitrophica bacterium]|nr:hypothetical protein [Candidatus Omnitrophota bacterium]